MKKNYKHLPYRPGVGLLIINKDRDIFIGERFEQPGSWQLPQGGIDDEDGDFTSTIFRELYEETGIKNAEILGIMEDWQRYDLPEHLITKLWNGQYRGQKQKWVALQFTGINSEINLHTCRHPEFQAWKWEKLDTILDIVIPVKRKTYETVFEYFKEYL